MCCPPGSAVPFTEHRLSRFTITPTGPRIWEMIKKHLLQVRSRQLHWPRQDDQPVLGSLEGRHWLLLSSQESPRWHLLPVGGSRTHTENLWVGGAAFGNDLGSIFWITCRSSSIGTSCFALHVYAPDTASFLKPQEPISASFRLCFCSFLPSSFTELKRVRASLWVRLWLKGMSWLAWPFIRQTFSTSAIKLFHFPIIRVFTGVALLISFRSFSFAFTTWLTGTRGLSFPHAFLTKL